MRDLHGMLHQDCITRLWPLHVQQMLPRMVDTRHTNHFHCSVSCCFFNVMDLIRMDMRKCVKTGVSGLNHVPFVEAV